MKTIAIINHQDSFVFNLVHIIRHIPNVEFTIFDYQKDLKIDLTQFDLILLSPGPGEVSSYTASLELIKQSEKMDHPIPILGICLGHQLLGYLYGMSFERCKTPMHGVQSTIVWSQDLNTWGVKKEDTMQVGRYHSWVVANPQEACPIEIDAISQEDHLIMALHHKQFPFYGLQFHPESILTPHGAHLLETWIKQVFELQPL